MTRVAHGLLFVVLGGGLVLLAGGCKSAPKLVPVSGKVAFSDGRPVETGPTVTVTGYVVFSADPTKGNTSMEVIQGSIGPDGSYKLLTRDKEGAFPGWYKVTVDVARTNPKDPYDYKRLVDDRFVDKDKSGIAVEVVENPEPGRYDLKVERHPNAK
jgi:hypothetical protein